MQLTTHIEGYKLVCIKDYNASLEILESVCKCMKPIRESLLHDIRLLEQKDQNTFAKSIRLLDKFTKQMELLCRTHL